MSTQSLSYYKHFFFFLCFSHICPPIHLAQSVHEVNPAQANFFNFFFFEKFFSFTFFLNITKNSDGYLEFFWSLLKFIIKFYFFCNLLEFFPKISWKLTYNDYKKFYFAFPDTGYYIHWFSHDGHRGALPSQKIKKKKHHPASSLITKSIRLDTILWNY